MLRMRFSQWALAAVTAVGASAALAGGPAASQPVSESYFDEIQLVSHCDVDESCDTCVSDMCDGCDSCDGAGCGSDEPSKFLYADCLKNLELCLDECGDPMLTLSAGGALRYRFYNEDNRLRPPGAGTANLRQSNYSQWRFTPYLQADVGKRITAYVQGIDAPTFDNDIGQLPIDENRFDLLQYYVDVKLAETDRGVIGAKVGRQLLLYGDQHVVSPLAWANTFRNFEGSKIYFKGENWDVDALINMQSVNAPAGNIFRPNSFDTRDESRSLNGVYATYRGLPKGTLDLYWLWSREDEPGAAILDGNRHMYGARWYGKKIIEDACGDVARTWSYDLQGAYQVGEDSVLGAGPGPGGAAPVGIAGGATVDVEAGFFNATASHTWNQVSWTPTLTGLFYYGSGDQDLTDDTNDAVYTLYPLGHAYWGLADNFSGQNLINYMAALTVKPTKKLRVTTALHFFEKAEAADAIYNIAGVRLNGTEGLSQEIGTELDIVATYALKPNVTLEAGYFWFWYGDGLDAIQANGGPTGDSDTFYFLANWVF